MIYSLLQSVKYRRWATEENSSKKRVSAEIIERYLGTVTSAEYEECLATNLLKRAAGPRCHRPQTCYDTAAASHRNVPIQL